MLNPDGILTLIEQDGTESHCDTFKCGHCQRIVKVPPRCAPEKMGGMCKTCSSLICPRCVQIEKCIPFELKLERIESRNRFLRQAGIA